MTSSGLTFDDPALAARFRDIVKEMVRAELRDHKPALAYATVASVDNTNRKATVTFTGEADPVTLPIGTQRPPVGARVRIEGETGDRYVTEVVDQRADVFARNLDVSGTTTFGGTLEVASLTASGLITAQRFVSTGTGSTNTLVGTLSLTGSTVHTISGSVQLTGASSALQLTGASSSLSVAGTLSVTGTGAQSIAGTLSLPTGAVTHSIAGSLTISTNATVTGTINANGNITSSGTWLRLSKQTKVEQTTEPTTSSTNHAFDIGAATDGTGLRLKMGPSTILAASGTSASVLKLQPGTTGGALLVRDRQVAPLWARTGGFSGGAPAANSSTDAYWIQAGTTTVSFSSGNGTLSFPSSFPNGLLAVAVSIRSDGGVVCNPSASGGSASSVPLVALSWTAPITYLTGSVTVSFIAIGW